MKVPDGLYVANWYGYTGTVDNENASVEIPFISVHSSNGKLSFPDTSYNSNECGVVINGKMVTEPNLIKWQTGETYKDYTFYTLIITLPILNEGIYNITVIKIPVDGKETYYPIHWIVEVKDAKEIGKCLKITGQSGLSGSILTGIDFRVKNSCNLQAVIDEIHFELPGYNIKPSMFLVENKSYENKGDLTLPAFERTKEVNKVVIEGLQERWVRVKFNIDTKNLPDFVSIKPFVVYHTSNSSNKNLLEFYSQSIFSKFPQNKEEVEKLLLSNFIKGKNTP